MLGMSDNLFGPELNAKRVAALISSAAIIVLLFCLRTCGRQEKVKIQEPKEYDYVTISPYDSLFRAYGDSLCDWKMLAAIAYVESGFDTTHAEGGGPVGMMQLMPTTYHRMLVECGMDSMEWSNELNVMAASMYVHHLDSLFSFISMPERMNYILGSYNGGPGHVFDAMRLARRDGVNRYVWSNIAEILPSLAHDSVHTDQIVRAGRFEGITTIRYVEKVQKKFQEYKQLELLYDAAQQLAESL